MHINIFQVQTQKLNSLLERWNSFLQHSLLRTEIMEKNLGSWIKQYPFSRYRKTNSLFFRIAMLSSFHCRSLQHIYLLKGGPKKRSLLLFCFTVSSGNSWWKLVYKSETWNSELCNSQGPKHINRKKNPTKKPPKQNPQEVHIPDFTWLLWQIATIFKKGKTANRFSQSCLPRQT